MAATPTAAAPTSEGTPDPFYKAIPNADAVISAAHEVFADRYGGAYVDRTGAVPALRVYVVNPTADDRARLDGLAAQNPNVSIVPSTSSYQDMQDAMDSANALLIEAGVPYIRVTSDVAASSVSILVNKIDDQTAEKVRASLDPRLAVSIKVDPTFAGLEAVNACRSCFPPYEGGLVLSDVNQSGQCTTGLPLKNPDNGQKFGTTAGHCGLQGDYLNIGGTFVNQLGQNSLQGHDTANADVARYQVSDQNFSHQIYTAPSEGREIVGGYHDDGLVSNLGLCFQGSSSGNNNCGAIDSQGKHPETLRTDLFGIIHITHAWCTTIDVHAGDSGGPVYSTPNGNAKVAGTVMGKSDQTNEMCFTGRDGIENEMNAVLVTGNP